jgi:hypothetical protein
MICDGCKAEVTRARWITDEQWLCRQCDPGMEVSSNVSGAMFPYVTSNLNGEKIQVQSLRHLRKLESQFGMQNAAFNMDSHNFDAPPRGR